MIFWKKKFRSLFSDYSFLQTLLLGIWIAGLSLGLLADRRYGDSLRACVAFASYQIPVFWEIFLLNLFPFLISAFAALLLPWLLYVFCFAGGFLLGFLLAALSWVFFSASGLVGFLLLFSRLVLSPIYLLFCRDLLINTQQGEGYSWLKYIGVCFLVSILDAGVIAPFLAEIMRF